MLDLIRTTPNLLRDLLAAGGIFWVLLLIVVAVVGALGYYAFSFLAVGRFLNELSAGIKSFFSIIIPNKWDSSKTLILLSMYSWVVSLFVSSRPQTIIAFCGWFFLIGGVHWVMHEEKGLKNILTINGIFIGPWITGALICYFLFATPDEIPAIAYILWPGVSAVIAAIPRFIGSDSVNKVPIWIKPKPADRQYLVNMVLINLLLSCWIQLTFTTRLWLAEYPSLQADDLSNSAFVVNTQPNAAMNSKGVNLLARAEAELKANLEGQSWSQVERWLLDFDDNLKTIEQSVIDQMPRARENNYWSINGRILEGEYNVQLFSLWNGPSSDANGYHYSKTCQISRVTAADVAGQLLGMASTLPAVGNAKVQCSQAEGPIKGTPEKTGQS